MTVFRNDEITMDELIAIRPTQLVVSPGPGELSLACEVILSLKNLINRSSGYRRWHQ